MLTSRGVVHPGEGDASIFDALTEAQKECASLFLLQQGLLFAFTHKTHNGAAQDTSTKMYFSSKSFG